MLRDWIDHHGFNESLLKGYDLVHWEKVPLLERRLALCHAERRATAAMREYVMLGERTPWGSRDQKEVKLSKFVNLRDEDPLKKVLRYDIDKLPDLATYDISLNERTPGTIVILAKVYHRIMERNNDLAIEIEQWALFLVWLDGSPEMAADHCPERDWRLLLKYSLSDRVLEEGAYFIPRAITKAITDHNNAREEIITQSDRHIRPMALSGMENFESGSLPPGCVDICTATSIGKARYSLSDMNSYPQMASGSIADERAKDRARVEFTRSLAYRAKTFNEIRLYTKAEEKKLDEYLEKKAKREAKLQARTQA
jgi:hypothetical protein